MVCCGWSSWLRWTPPAPPTFTCVRVVHLNGFIQDYQPPVTAGEVTGQPPKHVICSSTQLLIPGSKQIRADELLEPGRIYFLLPNSILQSNSSPLDMTSIVSRLTELAKKAGPNPVGNGPVRLLEPVQPDRMEKDFWERRTCGGRGWKPDLDTIEEKYTRSSTSAWSPDAF